eukprot:3020859-Ditylum_brightwellii.AAC.1
MKTCYSKEGNILIWSYMDSSLVFILDTCWGGTIEPFVCRDKETGERKYIGDFPKALNKFNNKMLWVDYWDLICAPKHRKYYIKMFDRHGKWTIQFGRYALGKFLINIQMHSYK